MKTLYLFSVLLGMSGLCSAISPVIHKLAIVRNASAANSQYGHSVALNERYMVVGAASDSLFGVDSSIGIGAVYVYDAATRKLLRTLKPDVQIGSGPAGMNFGYAVTVSASKILVGAPGYENNKGAVFVFDMAKSATTLPMKLQPFPSTSGDFFGISVATEGEVALIGAIGRSGNRGAAYTFNTRTGYESRLLTDTTAAANDYMGKSVALSGDIAFVYASQTTGGSIRRYNVRSGGLISETFAPDVNANHTFGNSMAASGPDLYVGDSSNDNGGSNRGAIYNASILSNSFVSRYQIKDASNEDKVGYSVAASGGLILCGSIGRQSLRGQAVLFGKSGEELGKLAPLDLNTNDYFGYSVALDGSRALVSAPAQKNAKGENLAGAVYVFEGLAGFMDGKMLARRGNAAPGTIGGSHGDLGLPTVNQVGVSIYSSAIKSSSKTGPTFGVFTDLGIGFAASQFAAVLNNTDLSGLLGGSFAGTKILSISQPSMINDFSAQFLATLTGSGVQSGNRTVLIRATSTPGVSSMLRTGNPVAVLGNSELASMTSVVAMESTTGLRFTLKPGTGNASAESDSGYYNLSTTNFSREGSPTPTGGGERFGQFNAGISSDVGAHTFISSVIASDNSVTLGVFSQSGVSPTRIANSLTVPGIPGAGFTQFISAKAPHYRGIIKGGGSSLANNDGIWSQTSGIISRKDDQVEAGIFVKRIEAYWPHGNSQLLLLAQLRGSSVKSSNDRGLYFRQSNGTYRLILRTGYAIAGLPGATVSTIQKVDVAPVSNGRYAILVGLKGTASSANQALLVGDLNLGDNDDGYPQREPRVLLQKGHLYTTAQGTPAKISSINIFSALRADGLGNPGVGCSTFDNKVAVRLDFSNKSQESWLVYW